MTTPIPIGQLPELTLGEITDQSAIDTAVNDRQASPETKRLTLQTITALSGGGGGGSVTVLATMAALRAASQQYALVYIEGHSAPADGGEGYFAWLSAGGTQGDIGSGGEDDNGWHVVSANGDVYGRVANDICTPQQFGAVGYANDAAASAGSDQAPAMQRWVDFRKNPTASPFAGAAYRDSGWRGPAQFIAPDGLYRCESTIIISEESTADAEGYVDNFVAAPLLMQGRVFVPSGSANDHQIGIRYEAHRKSGSARLILRAVKERTATGVAWWSDDNSFPDLYEETETYPAWSSTAPVYSAEKITHVIADGRTIVYRCDNDGTLGATAPTHDTGSVTNGDVKLTALGSSTTTAGLTAQDVLKRNRDWGIHIDDISEHRDVWCDADGFTVGVACIPRESSLSWIGWSKVHIPRNHACKIALLCVYYRSEFNVANQTERLALTGLRIGTRVGQDDDPTNDYVFEGPLGGEATPGNWTASPTYEGTENWCNDNTFEMGLSVPKVITGVVDNSRSCYGVLFDAWGTRKKPSFNHVNGLALEQITATGNAEIVQAMFNSGEENHITCRNDVPRIFTALKCSSFITPTDNPNRNLVETNRNGRLEEDLSYRRDQNNGYWNVSEESPYREMPAATFQMPNLHADASFSGTDRVYFKNVSSWRNSEAAPRRYLDYRQGTNGTRVTQFHPDDLSWTMNFNDGVGVMVDLPQNITGLALIRTDIYFSQFVPTANSARVAYMLADANDNNVDPTGRPRVPVLQARATSLELSVSVSANIASISHSVDRTSSHWVGLEPWVRRIFVKVYGQRILGFAVRVYGPTENCRIYSPAHDGSSLYSDLRTVQAPPERGIYTSPAELALEEPQGGLGRVRLNKPVDGNIYHATSGQTTAQAPGSTESPWGHDGGAQGSANISEWNGTAWDIIATNAYYAEPADWYYS